LHRPWISEPINCFVMLNTFIEITFALSLHLGLLPEQWRQPELNVLIENVGHV